jgi:hypothetical protein
MATLRDCEAYCEAQAQKWVRLGQDCMGDLYRGIAYGHAAKWGHIKGLLQTASLSEPEPRGMVEGDL